MYFDQAKCKEFFDFLPQTDIVCYFTKLHTHHPNICNKETKHSRTELLCTKLALKLSLQVSWKKNTTKKGDLETSHKIFKQQWALKCSESHKRLFVSSLFSSKRKARSSLYYYDKELGVSALTKTPWKIPVPCSRSLLKPPKVGQIELLSTPTTPATVTVLQRATPQKLPKLQSRGVQIEKTNSAKEFHDVSWFRKN